MKCHCMKCHSVRDAEKLKIRNVTSSLGVSCMIGPGKYLRLSFTICRKKKQVFGFLKDRLWSRINHWSSKYLSKSRKEVLLKSCAPTIPSYRMSVHLLPSTLEDVMQKMMNFFGGMHQIALQKESNGSVRRN